MDARDRKPLGAAGLTADECREKAKTKAERDLQAEVRQYLNLHRIEFINPDMRRRSTLPVGWPDFTFAYRGTPLGVECKVWGERPRPEQVAMHQRLAANGWTILVAYSVADIQRLMRELDGLINPQPKVTV